MGHGHVHRVTGEGLPAPTFVVKQKVKVLIELSLAEFKENNVEDRWKNFRGNDAVFLRTILYDLLPAILVVIVFELGERELNEDFHFLLDYEGRSW